jgi:hypothetical protein
LPLIQEVTVLSVNDVLLGVINPKLLCQVNGKDVEIPLIEELQFLLNGLFVVSENLKQLIQIILLMGVIGCLIVELALKEHAWKTK